MNVQKLYEARKKKGYSQEDLANICGVSRQAVSKWETGQTVPDSNNLIAIAKALDISLDYLLDNEVNALPKDSEEHDSYEYRSEREIFGIPLVHIHYSRRYVYSGFGVNKRRLKTAKGIIAIGDRAVGILSVGLFSLGIINIGILGLGILGLSIVQLGLFSFGIISVGFSATGIIAIGIYATGIIALATEVAVGVVALGKNSFGVVAVGQKVVVSIESLNKRSLCDVNLPAYEEALSFVTSQWLPQPLKFFLKLIIKC